MNDYSVGLAIRITDQLTHDCPRRTGNMKRNIRVEFFDNYAKIYISAPMYKISKYGLRKNGYNYARDVNEKGKHRGWIQKAINKAVRAYALEYKGKVVHE